MAKSYLGEGPCVHILENKNMTKDSAVGVKVRKRIRNNHNELERIRRNHQKQQLEALRIALPFTDMDERASMVAIIARSREYIELLEKRVDELQTLLGMPVDVELRARIEAAALHAARSGEKSTIPSKQTTEKADFVTHQGVQFYQPTFTSASSSSQTSVPRPSLSPHSDGNSNEVDASNLNADLLTSFLTESHPELLRVKWMSSDDENFMKTFRQRRESSLLLPIQSSDSVIIQKRDSFSSLFSGLLPDVVEESALVGEVKCVKCSKGLENMIMVDCDRCRKWYHLVCAGVDATSIPTFWTCKSCLKE